MHWIDIDYMVDAQSFTINKDRFPDLSEVVDDLHSHGQHFIIIQVGLIMNTSKAHSIDV